jgi:hypothetical protein
MDKCELGASLGRLSALPFNTFSNILLADGQTPDPELGGNCIHFTHRLLAEVPGARPLASKGTAKHYAGLLSSGDSHFFLDPSIGMLEPLDLALATRGSLIYVNALPVRGGGYSKVTAKLEDDGVRVFYEPLYSDSGHVSWFFNLDQDHNVPPQNYISPEMLSANRLYIETNRRQGGGTRAIVEVASGFFSLSTRDECGVKTEPDSLWEELGEIREKMLTATTILKRLARERYRETGME